jgi:hypothetical protein
MVDEGPETVAKEIAGTGLDAISLAATYHSFDALRPRRPADGGRILTVDASAGYYPFDPAEFSKTPLLPQRATLVSGEDWSRCSTAAVECGLSVVAWTIFLHNSFLVRTHPDLAQMTCFGDPLGHQLCPMQPAVRAYAQALASDICRLSDIDVLECEGLSFGGFGHTHYHPKIGVELGAGGRFLMSLCFCSACTSLAEAEDIEVSSIRSRANEQLDVVFETGSPLHSSAQDMIDADADLRAFSEFRERSVTELVRSVALSAGKPIRILAMGDRHTTALDVNAIAPVVDAVEYLCYTSDATRIQKTLRDAILDTESAAKVGAAIQAYPSASPTADTLITSVSAARNCGVNLLSFYNFGLMPKTNMGWIKRALESPA